MSGPSPSTTDDSDRLRARERHALAGASTVVIVAVLAFALLGGAATGSVIAQSENNTTNETLSEKAPYYNGTSTDVGLDSWLDGRTDPSLDNITALATRVGPFIIGSGAAAPGGGPASTLMLALVVGGMFGGAMMRAPLGTAGGGVLAVITVSGLVAVGLVPTWIWAAVLLGVGGVLASVVINVWR
jgi:hypothetical protein